MSIDEQTDGVSRKIVVALVGVVLFFAILGMISVFSKIEAERAERAEWMSRPTAPNSFKAVTNDCGRCGTDSPVGGWEATDGRMLILNESGTFVAYPGDDTTIRGDWSQPGDELCLSAAGARTCLAYEQKVDAMKLDDVIYIRQ